MNEITDKTKVLLYRGGKYYLNDTQATTIQEAIKQGGSYIEIEGDLIMINSVIGVISTSKYIEQEKIKRGEWQCKYGEWHERNQQCGHDGIHK